MNDATARRDVWSGALLVAIGIWVLVEGYSYDTGSLTRMGGGFFPVVLGLILAALGAVIAISALPAASFSVAKIRWPKADTTELRGFAAIVLGVVSFIVVVRFFGLAPAAFATVFVAALGDRTSTVKGSVILALVMTVFAVGLFSYVLHVQLPVFQFPVSWGLS
jgi:hypothetical protein